MMIYFLYYLCIVNIISFLLMVIDKYFARTNKHRISEFTLFSWAWIGGSIAVFIAMILCHHKIRKWKFKIGIPLILLNQIAFIVWLIQIN